MWSELGGASMRIVGELFCANVAHWGQQTGLIRPGLSQFGGNSWSPWTYAVTGLGGWVLGKFIIGRLSRQAGLIFNRGVADTILRKLLWTEVIGNVPAVNQYFGATQVEYDANGNTWMAQGDGSWDAMQGMGQLVPERALDGYGQLVAGRALDGYGHAPLNDPKSVRSAKYEGTGYASPFQSAYTSG